MGTIKRALQMKSLLCAILLLGATLSLSSCGRDSTVAPHIYIDTVTIWDTLVHLDTIYLDTTILDTVVIIDSSGDTTKIDGYEPDNSFLEATRIPLDSLQSHLMTKDDIDWFYFSAENQVVYEISLANSNNSSYNISLYDATDLEKVKDEYISGSSVGGSIFWRAPNVGNYPFSINSNSSFPDSTKIESYSVRVRKYPVPHSDPLEPNQYVTEAKFLETNGIPTELSLTACDEDWIAFSVAAGNVYDIVIKWDYNGKNFNRYFYLYEKSKSLNYIEWESADNDEEGVLFKYYAKSDTTLYLKSYYSTDVPVFYSVSIGLGNKGTDDQYEPNNSKDDATPITVGVPYLHSLTVGDSDWLSFPVDSGETYKVLLNNMDTAYINVTFTNVVNGSNSETWNKYFYRNDSTYFRVSNSGTLYINLESATPFQHVPKNYTIQASIIPNVEDDSYEPDDTTSTATPLLAGVSSQDHSLSVQNSDWFTVSGSMGKKYSVTIETEGVSSGVLACYKAAFIIGGLSTIQTTPFMSNKTILSWQATDNETYYIKCAALGEEIGTYSISLIEE